MAFAKLGAQQSTWVAIMEKAYAFYRYNTANYADLEGGWMSPVYSALGCSGTSNFYSASNATALLNLIQQQLAAGKSVTYACNSPSSGAPLIGSHAYSVDHVNFSGGVAVSVTLRNPWGVDGAGNDGANDGYVTVSAQHAFGSFMGLVSSTV